MKLSKPGLDLTKVIHGLFLLTTLASFSLDQPQARKT